MVWICFKYLSQNPSCSFCNGIPWLKVSYPVSSHLLIQNADAATLGKHLSSFLISPICSFTRWPWLHLSILKLVPACLWQIYWSSFFNSSTLPLPLSLTGTRGFEIPPLASSPADIFLQTAWIKATQWDTWCSSQGAFRLVAGLHAAQLGQQEF